jgi:23S rRNA pseudouridine1911/1915/1917 synthase
MAADEVLDAPDELLEGPVELTVDAAGVGQRLDAFLAERFARHSRVQLRRVIGAGGVVVDGEQRKAAYRLRLGERIAIVVPEVPRQAPKSEAIPLDILYEDDWLIAVNKPPGMVVHPARGHWHGTLASALAHHCDQLSTVGGPARPGIVHRLDRDTSGVIVVAKNDRAHLDLASQFERRTTEKEYLAIILGTPDRDRDIVTQPIGIHPYQREKMAIRAGHSTTRQAETFYEVQQRFRGFALILARPKTGRTHQIRLHLAHVGCPVLCDRLYGGRAQITLGEIISGREDDRVLLDRQALHARRIKLVHPQTRQEIEFAAPLPADMTQVLRVLDQHRGLTHAS